MRVIAEFGREDLATVFVAQAGMAMDFSWKRSALRYREVYARALARARRGSGGEPAMLGH